MATYIIQEIKGNQLSRHVHGDAWGSFYWTQTTLLLHHLLSYKLQYFLNCIHLYFISSYCSCNWEASLQSGRPHQWSSQLLCCCTEMEEAFSWNNFAHILLASMEALSHIVYTSKEEKINKIKKKPRESSESVWGLWKWDAEALLARLSLFSFAGKTV